jgi:hypothetical protein
VENIQTPLWKSQTIKGPLAGFRRSPGRPPKVAPLRVGGAAVPAPVEVGVRVQPLRGLHPVRALLWEWLLELKVMGRSHRTIDWYQQKMDWYRRTGGVENLEELNAFELKRFLAEQQELGLSTQHHPRLLPGDQEPCQLVRAGGVPSRPERAPAAHAQGGAEGDVDLHLRAGGGDL